MSLTEILLCWTAAMLTVSVGLRVALAIPRKTLYTITAGPLTITDASESDVVMFKEIWKGSSISYDVKPQKEKPRQQGRG